MSFNVKPETDMRSLNSRFSIQRRRIATAAGLLTLTLAACDSDPITDPPDQTGGARTITVDASEGWAFVALDDEARKVTVADPASSTDWDMAFFATSVMLNGGDAGPGGVVAYCVCANANLTDEQVGELTAEAGLAAFEAVTAEDIPSDPGAWETDALVPALQGWYTYNPVTHVVSANPNRVWKLRTANGQSYAKLHVTGIEGATQTAMGRVTFEYAVQPAKGAAMGAAQIATVNVPAGARVYFSLTRGEVSDASEWDLLFEGWTIRLNGGVSGSGAAGAVVVDEPFDGITDASDMGTLYRGDTYGGAFVAHPWYRYNITGSDHQIWPTYDVYLVKRGSEVYKVQLISYYEPTTARSRHVTMRYQRLTD
ncbi:MAG TPA: HmuY family protein [Longimicrobiales bacterium]